MVGRKRGISTTYHLDQTMEGGGISGGNKTGVGEKLRQYFRLGRDKGIRVPHPLVSGPSLSLPPPPPPSLSSSVDT